jgi:hypothetical protein
LNHRATPTLDILGQRSERSGYFLLPLERRGNASEAIGHIRHFAVSEEHAIAEQSTIAAIV